MTESGDALNEADQILYEAGLKRELASGGFEAENIKFDPNVKVGFIKHPTVSVVKNLIDRYTTLARSTSSPSSSLLLSYPQIGIKVIDETLIRLMRGKINQDLRNIRMNSYREGQLEIMRDFLFALGQKKIIEQVSRGKYYSSTEIGEPLPLDTPPPNYVELLLDQYGYAFRKGALYAHFNPDISEKISDPTNPKRQKFLNSPSGRKTTQEVSGRLRGQISMLRETLQLLGHETQTREIERDAVEEIRSNPQEFFARLEKRDYYELIRKSGNLRRAAKEVAEGNDIIY